MDKTPIYIYHFLRVALIIVSSASLVLAQLPGAAKPNIIIILTDDMGFSDAGCFGGHFIATPNIDRLVASGVQLTSYYSTAPVCSPSRGGLLTGMYPARWNFSTYLDTRKLNSKAQQANYLDTAAPSIARFFKAAGYATAHFGKWHLGGGRDVKDAPGFEKYGFDEHASTWESPDPDPLLTATNWIWSNKDSIKRWNRTQYFVDKTLAFMAKHKDQPCFVDLWPDDVHTPWLPGRGMEQKGKYPMNPEQEQAFKLVLQEYDKQIGRLLDGLKALGIDKNTIIIFTSDNGPLPSFRGSRAGGLRGSKFSLYEGGTRMPFAVSWPGHLPEAITDTTSIVTALDLFPSLATMAGLPLPIGWQGDGVDRSAVFYGTPSPRNRDMYWEYGRNHHAFRYPAGHDKSPNLAMRSGNWKLLMNNKGRAVELYNITADKNETVNLAASEPALAKALKAKLSEWWLSLPKLSAVHR